VPDVHRILRGARVVLLVVFAITAVNLAMPGAWAAMFSIPGAVDVRGGFISLIGPFEHPGLFGQIMSLALAALVSYATVYRSTVGVQLAVAASILGVVASFRRTAALAALAAVTVVLSATQRTRRTFAVLAILVTPAIAIESWHAIATIVSGTYSSYVASPGPVARIALYQTAGDIVQAQFPLGVGLGRYGGFIAQQHYSPVYYQYGLDEIYGLSPGGDFAQDTFWPAVAGEAGLVGLVAYIGGLVSLLAVARRLISSHVRELKFLGLLCAAWWVEYAIESVASPVYSAPPQYLLLFGAFGIAIALGKTEEEHSIERESRG
jgi:hypothetical protein